MGGKICAALDRQHPRDLFDVKFLLDNGGITEEIKIGFLLSLLGSERPMHEILKPNLKDQRLALANQFYGMTAEQFSYSDFEDTRNWLVEKILSTLTNYDKIFLVSVINMAPDWSIYDFERFPNVQWKMVNLQKLKEEKPDKHKKLVLRLEAMLFA